MNEAYCYCVLDRKAGVFNTPYFLINDAVAVRQLNILVNDKSSMIGKFPEDYILYCVGKFDMLKGKLVAEDFPREIIQAIQLEKKNEVKV